MRKKKVVLEINHVTHKKRFESEQKRQNILETLTRKKHK